MQDYERAFLYMYLLTNGLPDWAKGDPIVAFATLMGWDMGRAVEAFKTCEREGLLKVDFVYANPNTDAERRL